jgi:hypothetical protein
MPPRARARASDEGRPIADACATADCVGTACDMARRRTRSWIDSRRAASMCSNLDRPWEWIDMIPIGTRAIAWPRAVRPETSRRATP